MKHLNFSHLEQDENGIFLEASTGRKIVDPYCSGPHRWLGARIISEDTYFPLLILYKNRSKSNPYLVFASRNDPDIVLIWNLTEVEYFESHGSANFVPWTLILCIAGLADISKDLLDTAQKSLDMCFDKPQWALSIVDKWLCFCNDTSRDNSTAWPELSDLNYIYESATSAFVQDVLGSYLPKSNDGLRQLTADAKILLVDEELLRFNQFIDHFSQSPFMQSSAQWKYVAAYCLAREMFFLISGKNVFLEPFSGIHIVSSNEASVVVNDPELGERAIRLIKYRCNGWSFIERRGPSWLDVTSAIYLNDGSCISIRSGHEWGSPLSTRTEKQALAILFGDRDFIDSDNPSKYIFIQTNGMNLGHVLWNEASGYIEARKAIRIISTDSIDVKFVTPEPIHNMFSPQSPRDFVFPYVHKICNDISFLEQKEFFSPPNCCHIDGISLYPYFASFKYPAISEHLVSEITEACSRRTITDFNILINVRTHNKSHSNLPDCVWAFLEAITHQEWQAGDESDVTRLNLHFFVEYSDHSKVIESLVDVIKSFNVGYTLHYRKTPAELNDLVSVSDICIAPIGSGAVLPTWIHAIPTVLHGDRRHMNQLTWWPHVGGKREHLLPIPADSISDEKDIFYSDYSIEPLSFVSAVSQCIGLSRGGLIGSCCESES